MPRPSLGFNPHYASSGQLKQKARRQIPKFAFEFLTEGCMDDISLEKNRQALKAVTVEPHFINSLTEVDLNTPLFGHTYSAPFGVAPMGLQGLLWPNAHSILAKAAYEHNIPYILSTAASESLEKIAEVSYGQAWYQLYNPGGWPIIKDLIQRLKAVQYQLLVISIDVSTFGFRPRDFNNELASPPKFTLKTLCQALSKPKWCLASLKQGLPQLKNLQPYLQQADSHKTLMELVNANTMGGFNLDDLKAIRDLWPGKLILKGVMSEHDLQQAIDLGCDGVIFSNHGGRQLDLCHSPLVPLTQLTARYQDKITLMMDSGLRSGTDIIASLALGAQFTFLGRFFMYSVCALADEGGQHAIALLKAQLKQNMQQMRIENIQALAGKATLSR